MELGPNSVKRRNFEDKFVGILIGRGQMTDEDLVELKFRLYDGSDIGPIQYSSSYTVAMLKERIIAEWPKGWFFSPFLLF